MSHIRLIGLLLFITAITLALAAAATRTTHVQFNGQWLFVPIQAQSGPGQSVPTYPAHSQPHQEPAGLESSTTIPGDGSTATTFPESLPFPSDASPGPEHSHVHDWDFAAHQSRAELTTIPIAWPLLGTGAVGLLLWFIQAPGELRHRPKKRKAHRRRR